MNKGAIALALLLAGCGGLSAAAPSATVRPTVTVTPASASPSPVPSATALTSAKGSIVVRQPLTNARVRSPLTISGDASVFEAALQWRITDSSGRVLAEGITTASAGAPGRGTFTITATFTPPAVDTVGGVEVYARSPRDGTIDEIVRVPVVVIP